MKSCAYDKCGIAFEPKTHNQRYHSDDCCRRATNDRLMRNYYEKKARRQGHKRICETPGCTSPLSRYNEDMTCQKCIAEKEAADRQELMGLLSA